MPTLLQIDELSRSDYRFLEPTDRCYYLGEYTARGGFGFSQTNNLIHNFKKSMARAGTDEWPYKEKAIVKIAETLIEAIGWPRILKAVWVPAPPSKDPTDPLYDNRIELVFEKLKTLNANFDYRKCVRQVVSRPPLHGGTVVRDPVHLSANLTIDVTQLADQPSTVVVFDDVLTTGATFKAIQLKLKEVLPETRIAGIFVARVAHGASLPPV